MAWGKTKTKKKTSVINTSWKFNVNYQLSTWMRSEEVKTLCVMKTDRTDTSTSFSCLGQEYSLHLTNFPYCSLLSMIRSTRVPWSFSDMYRWNFIAQERTSIDRNRSSNDLSMLYWFKILTFLLVQLNFPIKKFGTLDLITQHATESV